MPSENLDLNVTVGTPVVEPGQKTTIAVRVSKNGFPAEAEIAIFVVDKAALDLKPVPLVAYNESLAVLNLAESYLITDTRSLIATQSAYESAQEILERRFRADPWILEEWPLFPQTYLNKVSLDQPDETYYSSFRTSLTYSSNDFVYYPYSAAGTAYGSSNVRMDYSMSKEGSNVGVSSASMSLSAAYSEVLPEFKSGGGNGGGSGAAAASTQVTLRTNFVSTPLFLGRMEVNETGLVNVEVQLPDNIGTFEVRVYAIDKKSTFGAAVGELISRRLFSLQSSAPSIVRNGDRFEAGVTITIHNDTFSDMVTIESSRVCELLDVVGPLTQTLKLKGQGPHLVNFQYAAIGTGTAYLLYKVAVGGKSQDAAVFPQDVMGQQEPVFIATSMSISGDRSDTEGFGLPPSVAYSGNLSIEAGVGRLPAVTYFTNLILQEIQKTYVTSDMLLASLMTLPVLSKYGLGSIVESNFVSSLSYLPSYTDSRKGLQMFHPYQYPYTNVRLQAFGLFVLSEVGRISGISQYQQGMNSLQQTWETAMWSQLALEAENARAYNGRFSNFNTLAMAYLGSSVLVNLNQFGVNSQDQADISLERLLDNSDQLSNFGKAALALALLRDGHEPTQSTLLLSQITNSFRIQGRTAYISEKDQSDPTFLGSAMALMAFVEEGEEMNEEPPLVEKLANFVAQEDQKGTHYWFAGEQIAHFIASLSSYDQWKENTAPDLKVSVQSGRKVLLEGSFSDPRTQPLSVDMFFEDLEDPNNISFTACCVGEASVVFGAKFVPSTINTEPIYRGISVNKVIQRLNPFTNLPIGPAITEALVGEQVLVTIEITIPDYSHSVVIVDPFPGAMEPLDDNIYDTSTISNGVPASNYWLWYIERAFSQKEYRKDKVIFYGQNLFSGTHSVTYIALVNTNGSFILPPALAYDSLQPELMGLSAGGNFTTKVLLETTLATNSCLPWKERKLVWDELPGYIARPVDLQFPPPTNPLNPPGMYTNKETDLASNKFSLSPIMYVGLSLGVAFLIIVIGGVSFVLHKKFSTDYTPVIYT